MSRPIEILSRAELLAKTNGVCWYCRCAVHLEWAPGCERMERDHKIPVARGGSDEPHNQVPACGRCNAQKRALTPEEYRAYLLSIGVVPKFYGDDVVTRDWIVVPTVPASTPDPRALAHSQRMRQMPAWPPESTMVAA